jgi:L-asparaginase
MLETSIAVLVAGGTIDKHYNPINGELELPASSVPEMLRQSRVSAHTRVEEVLLKDSLEMTELDRVKLLAAAKHATEDRILITHGTDTMVDTAKVLAADNSIVNKVIVLVGAMVPFNVSGSDALFNLGSAVMALELAQPGVYIAMNGRLFGYAEVIKNRQAGRFEYC